MMANSERDYMEARTKRTQRFQRVLAVVSIVSFLGSGVFGIAQLFQSGSQQVSQSATPESQESALKAQEQGFEMVLQREPENQVALEGLVQVRLQMKDVKGAIAPLEKMVKLHPERQDYKMVLDRVKQQIRGGDR